MKFLMFNVVVIGALAYLAIGPGGAGFFKSHQAGPAPLAAKPPVSKPVVSKDEIAAKAKEMYDRVYAKRMREAEKFFSMVEKEITEDETNIIAAADAKPVAPEIAPAPAPEPAPTSEPGQNAPVLTAAKEVKVVAVHKAPAAAAPVGTGKAIVTAQKSVPAAAPKFMTPRQRARELNRLVRDMEIFFADKLTN
ncbi:MAG: hypothetical protein VB959_08195 [Rhodospirillales bacterium]